MPTTDLIVPRHVPCPQWLPMARFDHDHPGAIRIIFPVRSNDDRVDSFVMKSALHIKFLYVSIIKLSL